MRCCGDIMDNKKILYKMKKKIQKNFLSYTGKLRKFIKKYIFLYRKIEKIY
jgi:hypothetical protein